VIPDVVLPRHRLSGEERSAFARGAKERKLRIVVDRATVPVEEPLELLLGLGHHPLIELLSTRAEGFAHLDIGPIDHQKDNAPTVIRRPDGSRTHMAVWPPHTTEAIAERHLRDHPDLGDHDELLRVLLLASASRDRGTDALVTASPVLIDRGLRGPVARDSNAMPVEAALALIGLYLRPATTSRFAGYKGYAKPSTEACSTGCSPGSSCRMLGAPPPPEHSTTRPPATTAYSSHSSRRSPVSIELFAHVTGYTTR
jgi:hypothetical protein